MIRRWLTARRARSEVDRRIPWPYSSLMTHHEREKWATGWRVTHWVCPSCGHRVERRARE